MLLAKLKSGTMLITIIVSLVIGLICASLILLKYSQKMIINRIETEKQLFSIAQSGISLLQSNSIEATDHPYPIQLFEQVQDSLMLHKYHWGIYYVLLATAQRNHISNKIAQLAGNKLPDHLALYLVDTYSPLVLCDYASIKGDASLPSQGVKTAYFSGIPYMGNKPIEGKIEKSKEDMPPLDSVLLRQLMVDNNSIIEQTSFIPDSLSNSFFNETVYLKKSGIVHLYQKLSGNIQVISDSIVIISAGAVLQNIIIKAPKIVVKSGFRGQLQLMASDSIIVEQNCTFNYPSALVLIKTESSVLNTGITIKPGSSITGSIFLHAPSQPYPKLVIDTTATIKGDIYANASVTHLGTISGRLACRQFYLQTTTGIFINYLSTGTINRNALPVPYVCGSLYSTKYPYLKGIVWLN